MKKTVSAFLIVILMLSACGNQRQETTSPVTKATDENSATYITVNGKEKELMASALLIAGYTRDTVVQFKDFYNFGLREERPIGFSGNVYLNGEKLESTDYTFYGYADNTTIAMKLLYGKQLTNNMLKIDAGGVLFFDDEAVVVTESFEAMWDGEKWTKAQEQEDS